MSEDIKAASASIVKKTLNTMPPRLQTLANSIKNKLEKANSSYIETVYDIGQEVAEIQDDTTGKLGDDPVGSLQIVIEHSDRGFLLKAARFYRLTDDKTLSWLIDARTKIGSKPLIWQHILVALPVDQRYAGKLAASKFKEMLKMAVTDSLTPEELGTRVRGELGGGDTKGAGGRPLAIPVGLDKKLANMTALLSTVVRNHNQIWSHDDYGLLRTIEDMPADKIDQSVIESIERQERVVAQAQEALRIEALQLEKVRRKAQDKYDEQHTKTRHKALPPRQAVPEEVTDVAEESQTEE